MSKSKAEAVSFEQSLAELEKLVEKMEHGELPLEDALKQFERGIELTRNCERALTAAEQRVEQLLAKNGEYQVAPLAPADDAQT